MSLLGGLHARAGLRAQAAVGEETGLATRQGQHGVRGRVAEFGQRVCVEVVGGVAGRVVARVVRLPGLTRTRLWKDATDHLDRPLYLVAGTVGLVAAILFVLLTYTNATLFARGYAPERLWDGIEARFVHSLVPIALGYTIAHYFSFAVFQGQAGYLLVGSAEPSIDYTFVSPQTIALVQVGAIGHVVGVVAAHDRAVATFGESKQRAGQYSLLTVMVAYTMGGIGLLVGS
jgi:hypothetical protein